MEPDAVNTLEEEAQKLREEVSSCFPEKIPKQIEYIFGVRSFFFQEEVLAEWRRQERYDELIEYILYQYEERGGEDLWKQVLLDLRLKNDEKRVSKLLDGLFPGRAKLFLMAQENYKKHPDNHFSAMNYAITKGEAMKVLYEHAYFLENKKKEEQNSKKINLLRSKIRELFNGNFTKGIE